MMKELIALLLVRSDDLYVVIGAHGMLVVVVTSKYSRDAHKDRVLQLHDASSS